MLKMKMKMMLHTFHCSEVIEVTKKKKQEFF